MGAATAYFLSREGVDCVVVERDGIASHASGYSYAALGTFDEAGMMDSAHFDVASLGMRLHHELADSLLDETGVNVEFRERPSLSLAFDEDEVVAAQSPEGLESDRHSWEVDTQGYIVEWLTTGGRPAGRAAHQSCGARRGLHGGHLRRQRSTPDPCAGVGRGAEWGPLREGERHRAVQGRRPRARGDAGRWRDRVRQGRRGDRALERGGLGLARRADSDAALEGPDTAPAPAWAADTGVSGRRRPFRIHQARRSHVGRPHVRGCGHRRDDA